MNPKYIVVTLMISILLVGCTGDQNNSSTDTAAEPDAVSIQLSWIHEYSAAAFHVAAGEGFFEAKNLDVTLLEGGFGEAGYIDPIKQVLDEDIAFGLAAASNVIEAQANGLPVVAVSAVLQRSPLALLSLEEKGIQRPSDLVGHSVMVADGGARVLLDLLLESQDIDPDSLEIISRTSFGVDPLLNGETDVLIGWLINEGVALEEADQAINSILMSDYGVDTYEFVIFTTEEMIESKPDVVQRMVDSVVQGIEFIVSNPHDAIEHTLTYNEELERDAQLRRLEATIPLMNVPGVQIGSMDPEFWQFTYDLLVEQGTIDSTVDLNSAFTLEFVNTASESE